MVLHPHAAGVCRSGRGEGAAVVPGDDAEAAVRGARPGHAEGTVPSPLRQQERWRPRPRWSRRARACRPPRGRPRCGSPGDTLAPCSAACGAAAARACGPPGRERVSARRPPVSSSCTGPGPRTSTPSTRCHGTARTRRPLQTLSPCGRTTTRPAGPRARRQGEQEQPGEPGAVPASGMVPTRTDQRRAEQPQAGRGGRTPAAAAADARRTPLLGHRLPAPAAVPPGAR